MKRRAQCSLTDYYGLANGWGYLRLICFIFVPFISCRYKNKLFLPHLLRPSPTCNLFSPNTPFRSWYCWSAAAPPLHLLLSSQTDGTIIVCLRFGQTCRKCGVIEQNSQYPDLSLRSSLFLRRQGQLQRYNVLNFRCTGWLVQGYMACRVPHVEDTPVLRTHRHRLQSATESILHLCLDRFKTDSQHLRDGRTRPRQLSLTIWLGRGSD